MLTKDQKKEIVKKLSEKIKASKSIIFADYKGITVKDLTNLKKNLHEAQAGFTVVKKTLLNLALKNSGIEVDVKKLEGQIAISSSEVDEVAPAKVIDKFSKTNENIKIVGGVLGVKEMTAEEAKALAKLPSKEELLARLVGSLKSPMSGMANVLAGNIRGLAQVLRAISEKKA